MTEGKINNYILPNVSKLKDYKKIDLRDKLGRADSGSDFKDLLKIESGQDVLKEQQGISLSSHAVKRMQERNLEMDAQEYFKLKEAILKLRSKGGRDSLVITNKAAYIVDVDNNKIVTAIDKKQMADNVFTKIDSTLFID